MADKILFRIDAEGTATVMLNRPEVHNAFDPEMVEQLTCRLRELEAQPAVRCVVLRGAGKSFCAGADIEHMKESATYSRTRNFRAAQHSARMFEALNQLRKPTLAGVHGAVRGGGLGLVAACDIAIATRAATFRLSEVRLGIIPAMISPYLISAVGQRMARRYMLSGEEFDAVEAVRIGLVHEVVEERELDARITRMLGELRSGGPAALSATKDLIPLSARGAIDRALVDETARRIAEIRATPEAEEGLAAFLDKRQPAWSATLPKGKTRQKRSS
jgi:methylglutaconyl-CoA hydratase